MVPGVFEGLVHGEGEEEEPRGEEARSVAGVEEGHRRRQEALAPPQGVRFLLILFLRMKCMGSRSMAMERS